MLTLRELLMQLPEDVRQLAIDNTNLDYLDSDDYSTIPVKDALKSAFTWQESKEGSSFWVQVYNQLP